MNNKRIRYLIEFIIIFIIECLIAIFLKQGFIRENVGDILVVPCIYTMLRVLFPRMKYLALYVLIFAIIIEFMQLLNITTLISNNNKILSIALKKNKLHPIIITLLLSGTIICSTYMLLFITQVAFKHGFNDWLLLVFPINYIICSIKLHIDTIKKPQNNIVKVKETKALNAIYNNENLTSISLVMTIPLLAITISILCMFGQRPDEALQAFFETSDWNLSKYNSAPIQVNPKYNHYNI